MSDAEIEEKIKLAVIASKINVNNTVDTATLTSELNNQFGENGWTKTEIDTNKWKVVNGKSYTIDLKTGAIEKVTGIIVSANPSKVLVGETATITLALDGIDKTGDISFTVNPSSAATISNIKQTEEGATATVTIAEEATGSIEIEGKLDDDNKAKCTIAVILDVTNVAVDSNLSKVETGSTLNIANCITNKDSIEEFTIEAITAGTGSATQENDTTIIKGTAEGTVTVTITGTKSGKTKDIAVTVTKVEVLEVGSYVNYPVDYDNVGSSDSGTYIPKDEFAGKWRILDLGNYDENTKTYSNTKIVSAGVPLSYYHYTYNSDSEKHLTTGFFTTPINTETRTKYSYYRCGFKDGNKDLKDINNVKKLFYNNLTAKDSLKNPVVQAMTKEDLDKVYDPKGATTTDYQTYVNDAKFNDMLAIPTKDRTGSYADYWLGSAFSRNHGDMWYVRYSGYVATQSGNTKGVRPVVTLQTGISITKGTNGWNISMPSNN